MSDFLIYEQHDGIVTMTMNRPDDRNALSEESQMMEIVHACDRINRDDTIRVAILTGAGSAFSAGGNVKHMRDKQGLFAGSPAQIREGYRRGIQQIPLALYNVEVPVIAAMNGPAIGAGLDMACMCDVRIASDQAKFAASFIKLGIVPGDGGAWLMSRTVGAPKALELILTGDLIGPEQALACGLVSKVVPHAQLMDEARAMAQKMAAHAPRTVRLTKKLLRESQRVDLATSLELAAAFQALAQHTKDHDEAVQAFLEKRAPNFTGD